MAQKAVSSAVKREVNIGNFLLDRYKDRLSYFEHRYNIGTKDFLKKFESGKMGDEEDYFEWFAVAQAQSHWQSKIKELKSQSN